MNYKVTDGIVNLDFELSKLELELMDDFMLRMKNKGYLYLSVPTVVKRETVRKQECPKSLWIDDIYALGGSAEQGILQYFSDSTVNEMKIYAKNTCIREEDYYEDIIRVKEFNKIEQYCFCHSHNWKGNFDELLNNSIEFLIDHNITYRIVDMTNKDEGYHIKKYDIEIYTDRWGWVESHSCTYFGEEQTKRFNIKGATHTISNTGIASPRILMPFIK